MSYLNARVLDRGIESLVAEVTRLTVHATEPADYASADAGALGSKVGVSIFGPQNAAVGRKAVVGPVADGLAAANGTAAFWALLDDNNDRLLASAPLFNTLAVSAGNAFTVAAFDVTLPGVAP